MITKNGGYIIIDLKQVNLVSGGKTYEFDRNIKESYERIEANYYKAILLSGIVIDNVEKADVFTQAEVVNDKYLIEVYGIQLIISSDGILQTQTIPQSSGETSVDELFNKIKGTHGVTVTKSTDGQSLDVHLDADAVNTLSKALVSPSTAPTSTQLVGINKANAQTNISIGSGLQLSGNTLSATGGSGGPTKELYVYNVIFDVTGDIDGITETPRIYCFLFSSSVLDDITSQTLLECISYDGYLINGILYMSTGTIIFTNIKSDIQTAIVGQNLTTQEEVLLDATKDTISVVHFNLIG